MANGRTVAPVRRVLAGIIGTIAVFVVFFGAGRSSWATAALGVALLILAIGLVAVNAMRGGGRAWIAGTGHVLSVAEPPANSAVGRCELRIVVDAPGLPAAAVKIRDPRVPVAKWPDQGATLPILVAVDDPRRVRIQWDDVLTHGEAAEEERYQEYAEEVRVEPTTADPDDDTVVVTERVSTVDDVDPATGGGTLDLADDVERVRDEKRWLRRSAGAESEAVIVRQTPAGPVVEGRVVEPVPTSPDAGAAEPDRGVSGGGAASASSGGGVSGGGGAPGAVPAPRRKPSPRPRPGSQGPPAGPGPTAGATAEPGGASARAGSGAATAGAATAAAPAGAATLAGAATAAPEDRPRARPTDPNGTTTTHEGDDPAENGGPAENGDDSGDDLADLITAYPSARPGPTGSIHGVGITVLVTDLDRSIAFYRDMLGFFEIDGGEGNAVLASGDTRLVLRQIPEVSRTNRRVVHLNLEVGDVDATYRELKGKGVRFTYAPRAVNKGEKLELWAAAFQDPDGHGIAITQWRARPAG